MNTQSFSWPDLDRVNQTHYEYRYRREQEPDRVAYRIAQELFDLAARLGEWRAEGGLPYRASDQQVVRTITEATRLGGLLIAEGAQGLGLARDALYDLHRELPVGDLADAISVILDGGECDCHLDGQTCAHCREARRKAFH